MIDNLKDAIEDATRTARNLKAEAKAWQGCAIQSKGKVKAKECLECAADHEQLAGWLTELQERREADRWISVSERLPEDDGQYLVTREEYIPSSPEYRTFDTDGAPHWEMVVDLARFEGNFNRAHNYENHNNGFNKAYKVYAWKPLPKPYESEATNE